MAFKNVLNLVTQLGLETTPGTAVAATRRLLSMGIELQPEMEIEGFRPRGGKFKTNHILNREWTTGSMEGKLAFNEVQAALASVMSKPITSSLASTWALTTAYALDDLVQPTAPNGHVYRAEVAGTSSGTAEPVWPTDGSTVVDGTVTWRDAGQAIPGTMTFDMDMWSADDPQSFSVEYGDQDSGEAKAAAYMLFNSFTLSSGRAGEVAIGGSVLASKLDEAGTLTASVTETSPVVASPRKVGFYIDTEAASIGTTKVLNNFQFEHSISDRYGTVWVHDDADENYKEHSETEPSVALSATVADDAGLSGIITALRTGQKRYIKTRFVGPEIGNTGKHYALDIMGAYGVSGAPSPGDQDGTYVAELSFEPEYDPALGYALRAVLTTDETAVL